MKLFTASPFSRFALAVVATLVASCAMPPKEAWRYIRHEGLIPYLAIEMGNRPVPTLGQAEPNRYLATTPAGHCTHTPLVSANAPVAPASENKSTASYRVAPTPHLHLNNKPVASAASDAKPNPMQSAPEKVTPKKSESTVVQTPKPVKPLAEPAVAPVKPQLEAKVEQPKPKPVEPAKPEVAKSTPPATKPQADVVPSTVSSKPAERPYGTPVPGRPGLVNSPYAGKMQLVDVTGLKSGQEVKCPYTGKLFRVPPGEQAKIEEKK